MARLVTPLALPICFLPSGCGARGERCRTPRRPSNQLNSLCTLSRYEFCDLRGDSLLPAAEAALSKDKAELPIGPCDVHYQRDRKQRSSFGRVAADFMDDWLYLLPGRTTSVIARDSVSKHEELVIVVDALPVAARMG